MSTMHLISLPLAVNTASDHSQLQVAQLGTGCPPSPGRAGKQEYAGKGVLQLPLMPGTVAQEGGCGISAPNVTLAQLAGVLLFPAKSPKCPNLSKTPNTPPATQYVCNEHFKDQSCIWEAEPQNIGREEGRFWQVCLPAR